MPFYSPSSKCYGAPFARSSKKSSSSSCFFLFAMISVLDLAIDSFDVLKMQNGLRENGRAMLSCTRCVFIRMNNCISASISHRCALHATPGLAGYLCFQPSAMRWMFEISVAVQQYSSALNRKKIEKKTVDLNFIHALHAGVKPSSMKNGINLSIRLLLLLFLFLHHRTQSRRSSSIEFYLCAMYPMRWNISCSKHGMIKIKPHEYYFFSVRSIKSTHRTTCRYRILILCHCAPDKLR